MPLNKLLRQLDQLTDEFEDAWIEREVLRSLGPRGVFGGVKRLNEEGTRTRYGKEFKVQTVQNIIVRGRDSGN